MRIFIARATEYQPRDLCAYRRSTSANDIRLRACVAVADDDRDIVLWLLVEDLYLVEEHNSSQPHRATVGGSAGKTRLNCSGKSAIGKSVRMLVGRLCWPRAMQRGQCGRLVLDRRGIATSASPPASDSSFRPPTTRWMVSAPDWDGHTGSSHGEVQARWEAGQQLRLEMFPDTRSAQSHHVWKTMPARRARAAYCLSSKDIAALPVAIRNPKLRRQAYSASQLYFNFDVLDAAVQKFNGDRQRLNDQLRGRALKRNRRVARLRSHPTMNRLAGFTLRPLNHESDAVGDNSKQTGAHAVHTAIAGNCIITIAKACAAFTTGSGAMVSEAVHSGVDTLNQGLLAVGLERSKKRATLEHPYGHGHEMYVFALLAGVGAFCLGSGVAVYHGIHSLLHPEPIESVGVGLAVLLFAGCAEGYTLSVAWHEIKRESALARMSTLEYIRKAPDPTNTAVFLEDLIAVGGVGVAATGIGLSAVTGNSMYDAAGSITIGLLMGGVSLFLVQKNMQLLGGQRAQREPEAVKLLEADDAVLSVHDVKSTTLAPGSARLKVEVHFNPWTICDRFLDAEFGSSKAEKLGNSSARQPDPLPTTRTNLVKIVHELEDRVGTSDREEETKRVLRRFSRMYMTTLAMEIDRIESELRHALPEFKYVDIEVL